MIPYGRQDISQADIDAVVNILRSDFLTQGPIVPAFEKKIANYCKVKHAISVNSATSALHIACLALEVTYGDIVWTSPITFVASANCALYCGASIDFVDINPDTYNISIDSLAEKLQQAEKTGKLPKVVIPVHLCGQSCDMAAIHSLSIKYGFKIIEDASHAIGGKYQGKPIGNCEFSDITVFSFHPVKIITTGEGGMAVTNNESLAKKMRLLRSHGITREKADMINQFESPWYYEQIELGFNYRMTDIQSALGISQMDRLDDLVLKRHKIANIYDVGLTDLPVRIPKQMPESYSAYHLYPIRIKQNKKNIMRKQIYEVMQSSGINVNMHYIPVYRHPYYGVKGFRILDFPAAEQYYNEALSLPIYPTLTNKEQLKVIAVLNGIIG